jgi:methionyl-tRNA formyltransferase
VINQIRGLAPWPAATAELCGHTFKIFSAFRTGRAAEKTPGEIVSAEGGIEVACRDETIVIRELQAPGGKRMSAADYLRGHPLCL